LKAWGRYLFVNFTGYGAVKSLLGMESSLSTGKASVQHPGFTIVVQIILLTICVSLKLPAFYFAFWLAPLFTLTYGVSHFRTLLEHFNSETWQDPVTGETCYGAFYDFGGGFQMHIFGAQFGYSKHGTHHALPSIPNYNLSHVTQEGYRTIPENLIHSTSFFARFSQMLALSFNRKTGFA
jgi:fatty acid desaturase